MKMSEFKEFKILVGIFIFATILMLIAIMQGVQETRVQDQTQIKIIENEVKQ